PAAGAAGAAAAPLTAEPALKQFRETASPLAQELAGHLSAVPLVLPVMTLVRRAMLPDADHGHLAEVLLGGLLAPWEAPAPGTDPDGFEFDFLPGVRDALLGAQRREDVAEIRRTVRHQVAAYLRSRRTAADFLAGHVADGTHARAVAPGALPFAESQGGAGSAGGSEAQNAHEQPGGSGQTDWTVMSVAEALERPELLGVRPAEQRPGLPALTPYVRREVDVAGQSLAELAVDGETAAGLFFGGPAVGKTRACFEVLRGLPPDWTVLRAKSLLGDGHRAQEVGPRTVVWLDRADDVLTSPGEEDGLPAVRAELLAERLGRGGRPVLLLGTLRSGSVIGSLIRRALERRTSEHVLIIEVPERFTPQEAEQAVHGDVRLAEAARVVSDYRIVQLLLVAAGLRERLDGAPEEVQAVLASAADALALGHGPALSGALLEAAAPGYLTPEQRLRMRQGWFAPAMAYATERGEGGVGLFAQWARGVSEDATGTVFYTLHPLVVPWLHGLRPGAELPHQLRRGLLDHGDRGDLRRMAQGAGDRGWRRLAEEFEALADSYLPTGPPGRNAEPDLRPYFCLSHSGADAIWVSRLFQDLSEAILEITDVPRGVPVGFINGGQVSTEQAALALASCRVFVPLYARRYFQSQRCGREWEAFTRRPVAPRSPGAGFSTGIVPVKWIPMERYRPPEAATRLQADTADFGPDYDTEGLLTLMKLSYHQPAYELAVHRLARRIVAVAQETDIPVGQPLDLDALPSAFEQQPTRDAQPDKSGQPEPARELRVLVYAYRRDELPAGRSPDSYGQASTDWNPYPGELGGPLAEHAAELARRQGFQATVHDFDTESERILLRQAWPAPTLLLLDRWVLLDTRRKGRLIQVGTRNSGWMSVLEPWSSSDHEEARLLGERGMNTAALLYGQLWAQQKHSVSAPLADLEAFEEALPGAVRRAARVFDEQMGRARRTFRDE
ncbi:TIR-like protein FxsC, partial [Kitasatospora sp. NPDC056181]|uniref:TIR-like protein FxsC n=1 Tax=Kitasatospora sp. NPDC056181 TaxID=3345737 RepID=UPI0035E036E0